jgi:hypothetical protein
MNTTSLYIIIVLLFIVVTILTLCLNYNAKKGKKEKELAKEESYLLGIKNATNSKSSIHPNVASKLNLLQKNYWRLADVLTGINTNMNQKIFHFTIIKDENFTSLSQEIKQEVKLDEIFINIYDLDYNTDEKNLLVGGIYGIKGSGGDFAGINSSISKFYVKKI